MKKDKGTDNTIKQWPNLNEGQRDRQHNGQI